MAGVVQQGLVVIGCGDFGAEAVAYLRSRGAEPASRSRVHLLSVTGQSLTRAACREIVAGVTAGGWPEYQAAVRAYNSPTVALIGAAEEAAGGGILVALLQWLVASGLRGQRTVWLALPSGTGDRQLSRAYATLLELDSLRAGGAVHRCFLYEMPRLRREMAPLFADAAVAAAASPSGVRGYSGFGLCVWRESQEFILAEATARVALQAVAPGTFPAPGAAAAPPLPAPDEEERLGAALGALTAREYPPARSWLATDDYQQFAKKCRDPEVTPDQLARLLRRTVRESRTPFYHEGTSLFRDRVRAHWAAQADALVEIVALGRVRAAATGRAESVRDALGQLQMALEARRAACREKQRQFQRQEEEELTELIYLGDELSTKGASLFRKAQPEMRERLIQQLHTADQASVGLICEREREQALEKALQAVRAEIESIHTDLIRARQRAEQMERLRGEVARLAVPGSPLPAGAVHIFPPVVGSEAVESVAAKADLRLLYPYLPQGGPLDAGKAAQALLRAARESVQIALGAAEPSPTDQSALKAWLDLAAPGVRFAEPWPGPGKPPARSCRVAGSLAPAVLDAFLRRGFAPEQATAPWFDQEAAVIVETGSFDLRALVSLPALRTAYLALEPVPGSGLHVLPQPPAGWPGLEAPVRPAAARQGHDAPRAFLRGCLFGLVTPAADGTGWTARAPAPAPSPEGDVLIAAFRDFQDALESLNANAALTNSLGNLTKAWVIGLEPEALAAYGALALVWRTRLKHRSGRGAAYALLADAAAKELLAARTLLEAARPELVPQIEALAEQVGTAGDDFTLASGEWRYLKW
ncbi:MAG TPA: hypothetical protein VD969_07290 [Symbiobacteriaceae bacterium]|nr:hypothetical protein [Symbiobacteriaceae bacterium]